MCISSCQFIISTNRLHPPLSASIEVIRFEIIFIVRSSASHRFLKHLQKRSFRSFRRSIRARASFSTPDLPDRQSSSSAITVSHSHRFGFSSFHHPLPIIVLNLLRPNTSYTLPSKMIYVLFFLITIFLPQTAWLQNLVSLHCDQCDLRHRRKFVRRELGSFWP